MGPASLQGTLLQDLDPRRTQGDPGQNLDPGLNLGEFTRKTEISVWIVLTVVGWTLIKLSLNLVTNG